MITVITQSTNERKQETRENFHRLKPFLDKGYSYNKALREAGLINNPTQSWGSCARTRDVIKYAKKHGY
ncbi:hypothetical protein [uncultured Methanobrevibacter sp.]|uniref:hypothetical protein n=1 Tax=uncultured Methanobrevibacter sp. TaxID=253161 RepID=UPI0025D36FAC|nr:hypothetical protein [uncultured Methanobrevibacter sp.]